MGVSDYVGVLRNFYSILLAQLAQNCQLMTHFQWLTWCFGVRSGKFRVAGFLYCNKSRRLCLLIYLRFISPTSAFSKMKYFASFKLFIEILQIHVRYRPSPRERKKKLLLHSWTLISEKKSRTRDIFIRIAFSWLIHFFPYAHQQVSDSYVQEKL